MSQLNKDRTITIVYLVLYVISIVVFGFSSLPTVILMAIGILIFIDGAIKDNRQ